MRIHAVTNQGITNTVCGNEMISVLVYYRYSLKFSCYIVIFMETQHGKACPSERKHH